MFNDNNDDIDDVDADGDDDDVDVDVDADDNDDSNYNVICWTNLWAVCNKPCEDFSTISITCSLIYRVYLI